MGSKYNGHDYEERIEGVDLRPGVWERKILKGAGRYYVLKPNWYLSG